MVDCFASLAMTYGAVPGDSVSVIEIWGFGFVSDVVLRASNFDFEDEL
jgi:hypothetical protein